ncbi:VWA domain-containing protein [Desulfosporosinus sp. PR]|uniref:VWA domain-containing protein n=1 Tax=Candidatus Desulfosporosinus nitrosoreducens TaxID=3401928 RepID=UPI0027F89B90|nr:VWA domain-containing protein [Desulfosporosinus sp. PR]MDQ7095396.1 VWA domain-containing protein [Desulfosporosinus sp. PR]
MKSLIQGQKVKISDYITEQEIEIVVGINSSMAIDISCFGLDEKKQLADDRYMIFYNQMNAPEGSMQLLETGNGKARFKVNLNKVPSFIKSLVFTAAIDGEGLMSQISGGFISFGDEKGEGLRYDFAPSNFKMERAVIISELYFKDLWRLGAVGSGFDGGLSALLKHFGGEEAKSQEPSLNQTQAPGLPAAEVAPTPKKINLEKKMEQKAPTILSLAKKATISLKKVGLESHCAKVALCLDISGSMSPLYSSGKMQAFAEKILALGCRFDDDGAIDLFLFGKQAHKAGDMSIDNFSGFVGRTLKKFPLEGSTYYGKAIKMIRDFYSPGFKKNNLPVYVMFVTDGATFDQDYTKKQLIEASSEPIFWQFMAIGKSKKDVIAKGGGFFAKLAAGDFRFLEELDTMSGRYIDNANFFSVEDPSQIADDQLYDLLMGEYPNWLKEARQKSIL